MYQRELDKIRAEQVKMNRLDAEKYLKGWIRTQHLICFDQDFIFETVDQSHLERFEKCLVLLGGRVRSVEAVGNWPMGTGRAFKILRTKASVPRPGCEQIIEYWAKNGSTQTRYSDINS